MKAGMILTTMFAVLLAGGSALAQEGAVVPYSVDTEWVETTVGDATVTLSLHLELEPWDVYEKFVAETANWWSRGYTLGQDECLAMQLEAYAGGRLLEIYENGEVQWAEVLQVEPGNFIGMGVPEGSFWSGAGSINISFNPGAEGGTDLVLVHRSFQQFDADIDGAEGYAEGWSKLIGENFRRYCEGEFIEDAIFFEDAPADGVE